MGDTPIVDWEGRRVEDRNMGMPNKKDEEKESREGAREWQCGPGPSSIGLGKCRFGEGQRGILA